MRTYNTPEIIIEKLISIDTMTASGTPGDEPLQDVNENRYATFGEIYEV